MCKGLSVGTTVNQGRGPKLLPGTRSIDQTLVAEATAHAAEDVPEVMQVRSGLGDYICHRKGRFLFYNLGVDDVKGTRDVDSLS